MAGLSGRMSTVIKAKVSKVLDRAEDPAETLDYSYQKQLESLQKVKQGIADVVTAKKRLQLQSGKLEQSVVKLDTQARQALAQGNEELAREALERKNVAQTELQSFDTQITELEGQQQKLTDSEAKLRTKIEGQKTAAFELIEALGPERPLDLLAIPVGNAGNITAYWKGFSESADQLQRLPKMLGFQAAGAAPLVLGHAVERPETLASAIRIGDPALGDEALDVVEQSGGAINSVTDEQILEAYRLLADHEGVFCEPSSAASVAGLLVHGLPEGAERVVCVLTGHGLKDPETAIEVGGGIIACEAELAAVEAAVWG